MRRVSEAHVRGLVRGGDRVVDTCNSDAGTRTVGKGEWVAGAASDKEGLLRRVVGGGPSGDVAVYERVTATEVRSWGVLKLWVGCSANNGAVGGSFEGEVEDGVVRGLRQHGEHCLVFVSVDVRVSQSTNQQASWSIHSGQHGPRKMRAIQTCVRQRIQAHLPRGRKASFRGAISWLWSRNYVQTHAHTAFRHENQQNQAHRLPNTLPSTKETGAGRWQTRKQVGR